MNIDYINKNALEYNKDVASELKSIAEPFLVHTGVTHFSYTRYIQGQRYMTLSLDVDMVEAFYKNNIDRFMMPTGLDMPLNSRREIFWDLIEDNESLKFLRTFEYGHGLSTFVRCEDVVESWHFASHIDNAGINQFYMNNKSLLDQFIMYFKDKAKHIISPTDRNTMAVFSDGRSLSLSEAFDVKQHNQLDEALKIDKYPFNVNGKMVCLSKSEFDCLSALSQGLCFKAAAHKLSLSPRTVESYINKAKEKTRICSKGELLKMFRRSVYCAL